MATSGTSTFTETRDTIITNSLQLLGVVGSGDTAQANDITFGASLLNAMVKAWEGQGIHLWTEEEGTVYLVNGQAAYTIPGANGSDGSGTPVETTLTTAVSSGSTISVTSAIGMSSGDVIGIQLSNNTIQWTTINGAPSGNTVTLTAAITSAAAANAQVFSYTTAIPRALTITNVRLRDSSGVDRPIKKEARSKYEMIPQKNIGGQPCIMYYTPQLTSGTIYLWPTPNDVSQRLKITYWRTIQDFDNSTDNADFPVEWLECITYNLAVRLAPSYGINLASGGFQGNPDILRQAAEYLDAMKAWDADDTYIYLGPNRRNRFDRY